MTEAPSLPEHAPISVTIVGPQNSRVLLGLFIWFFLGPFGGYAYWAGNKTKAYARLVLWLSLIAWPMLGAVAAGSGRGMSNVFVAPFMISLLLLLIFWLFDLAHLLKGTKAGG